MTLEQALQDNTEALWAHTAALLGNVTTAPKTEKATTAKPAAPKAEKAAAKEPEAPAPVAGLDYETEVKPKVIAFVKSVGRETLDGIFTTLGVKSAKELSADKYQSFLDALAEAESAVNDVA